MTLVTRIEGAIAAEGGARASSFESQRVVGESLARRMPLIHRTGDRSPRLWTNIFEQQRLGACEPSESRRPVEQAIGWRPSVYFYVGVCAFPQGDVVIVFHPTEAVLGGASFTPFDSGSVSRSPPFCGPAHDTDWLASQSRRQEFIRSHQENMSSLAETLGAFAAGHFRDHTSYYTRGCPATSGALLGIPDWPAFHGLVGIVEKNARPNPEQDRRSWTFEIRVEGDIEFAPEDVARVFTRVRSVKEEMPRAWRAKTQNAGESQTPGQFGQWVAAEVIKMLNQQGA